MEDKQEKNKDEVKEYKESLQRLQAEFENYKKRAEKESLIFKKQAKAEIVKEFLPVLDSLESALEACERSKNPVLYEGIKQVYSQFCSALQRQGLKPIKAEGERFDPYLHEAQMQEESDEDGIVLEEFQKGYFLDDAVLRHSKVKVGKKRIDSDDPCSGWDKSGEKRGDSNGADEPKT